MDGRRVGYEVLDVLRKGRRGEVDVGTKVSVEEDDDVDDDDDEVEDELADDVCISKEVDEKSSF